MTNDFTIKCPNCAGGAALPAHGHPPDVCPVCNGTGTIPVVEKARTERLVKALEKIDTLAMGDPGAGDIARDALTDYREGSATSCDECGGSGELSGGAGSPHDTCPICRGTGKMPTRRYRYPMLGDRESV